MRPKLSGSLATIVVLGVVTGFGAGFGVLGADLASAAPPKGPSAAPKGKPPAGKAGDMEFEPENATTTPPSKTLERAIKL